MAEQIPQSVIIESDDLGVDLDVQRSAVVKNLQGKLADLFIAHGKNPEFEKIARTQKKLEDFFKITPEEKLKAKEMEAFKTGEKFSTIGPSTIRPDETSGVNLDPTTLERFFDKSKQIGKTALTKVASLPLEALKSPPIQQLGIASDTAEKYSEELAKLFPTSGEAKITPEFSERLKKVLGNLSEYGQGLPERSLKSMFGMEQPPEQEKTSFIRALRQAGGLPSEDTEEQKREARIYGGVSDRVYAAQDLISEAVIDPTNLMGVKAGVDFLRKGRGLLKGGVVTIAEKQKYLDDIKELAKPIGKGEATGLDELINIRGQIEKQVDKSDFKYLFDKDLTDEQVSFIKDLQARHQLELDKAKNIEINVAKEGQYKSAKQIADQKISEIIESSINNKRFPVDPDSISAKGRLSELIAGDKQALKVGAQGYKDLVEPTKALIGGKNAEDITEIVTKLSRRIEMKRLGDEVGLLKENELGLGKKIGDVEDQLKELAKEKAVLEAALQKGVPPKTRVLISGDDLGKIENYDDYISQQLNRVFSSKYSRPELYDPKTIVVRDKGSAKGFKVVGSKSNREEMIKLLNEKRQLLKQGKEIKGLDKKLADLEKKIETNPFYEDVGFQPRKVSITQPYADVTLPQNIPGRITEIEQKLQSLTDDLDGAINFKSQTDPITRMARGGLKRTQFPELRKGDKIIIRGQPSTEVKEGLYSELSKTQGRRSELETTLKEIKSTDLRTSANLFKQIKESDVVDAVKGLKTNTVLQSPLKDGTGIVRHLVDSDDPIKVADERLDRVKGFYAKTKGNALLGGLLKSDARKTINKTEKLLGKAGAKEFGTDLVASEHLYHNDGRAISGEFNYQFLTIKENLALDKSITNIDESFKRVMDAVRGSVDVNTLNFTEAKAAKAIRSVMDDAFRLAEKVGMKVKTAAGDYRVIEYVNNFLPRRVKADAPKFEISNRMIEHLDAFDDNLDEAADALMTEYPEIFKTAGEAKDALGNLKFALKKSDPDKFFKQKIEASGFLGKDINKQKVTRSFRERTLNISDAEFERVTGTKLRNDTDILTDYFNELGKGIAHELYYGFRNQKILARRDLLKQKLVSDFGEFSKETVSFMERYDKTLERMVTTTKDDPFLSTLRLLQIFRFSPTTTALQVTQRLLTGSQDVGALARSFGKGSEKLGVKYGTMVGNQYSNFDDIRRVSQGFDSKIRRAATIYMDKILRIPMFDNASRKTAAHVGEALAKGNFDRLLKNPRDSLATAYFNDLGASIDINAALKRGKLTELELGDAVRAYDKEHNFWLMANDIPRAFQGQWGRTLFQFKSPAYLQGVALQKFLIRNARSPRGMWNLMKYALAGMVGGEIYGNIDDIMSLRNPFGDRELGPLGKNKQRFDLFTEPYYRLADDLLFKSQMGGLVGDLVNTARYVNPDKPFESGIEKFLNFVISPGVESATDYETFLIDLGTILDRMSSGKDPTEKQKYYLESTGLSLPGVPTLAAKPLKSLLMPQKVKLEREEKDLAKKKREKNFVKPLTDLFK